jgi:rsbT co-antagonist protein RsbR
VVLLPRALPVMIFLPVMAIAVALPYLTERTLLVLSIGATLTIALIACLSEFVKLFQPAPGLLSQIIFILAVTFMCGLTLFLSWQYHRRQSESFGNVRSANAALAHGRAALAVEVAARTAELRVALLEVEARAAEQARLLDELAQQRDVIRELSNTSTPGKHESAGDAPRRRARYSTPPAGAGASTSGDRAWRRTIGWAPK